MLSIPTFNILIVKGKRHELEAFRQFSEGFDPMVYVPANLGTFNFLCFNNFIPLDSKVVKGESIIKLIEERKAKWGITSDACGCQLVESDHALEYYYNTCDGIPETVYKRMVELFPNLKFELTHKTKRTGIEGVFKLKDGKWLQHKVDKFAKEKAG